MYSQTCMIISSLLFNTFIEPVFARPSIPKPRAEDANSCAFPVDSLGVFTNHVTYTFTGTSLPSGLLPVDGEIIYDKKHVPPAPYNHEYLKSNLVVQNGYLGITVPGGQDPASAPNNVITGGQIRTVESQIQYASVRTTAIFSDEPGTCQSSFFYRSDSQEIDLEFLSDPNSKANEPREPSGGLHYTNQPTNGGLSTTAWEPLLSGGVEQEYRIDWVPGFTAFYIDGRLKKTLRENVPSAPGIWLWSNWANGDEAWTAGPPLHDNTMKIKSIEMYYNTTGDAQQSCQS